jgi:hypothetical protein
MSRLEFTVLEDGKEFALCDMSEPELAAIEECIVASLPNHKGKYWFEVDTLNDDESPKGRILCFQENPNPKNQSIAEMRIFHPLPKELEELNGERIRIAPRQLGLSPWGDLVEVIFSLS